MQIVGLVSEPLLPYRLGCLEQRRPPRRGAWRCTRKQAQMREYLGNHRGIFDGVDDPQRAATLRAGSDVEDALLSKGRSWPGSADCR